MHLKDVEVRPVRVMILESARRSLNLLLSEWGNRGLHYWEVGNESIKLNEDQYVYDIYFDADARDSSLTANGAIIGDGATYLYNATDILETSLSQSIKHSHRCFND